MSQTPRQLTAYVVFCVLTAALSPFQFGFHAGVINPPRQAMSSAIPMTDWEWGAFVSLFLLGGVIGGLSGGHLASALGRRRALLCTNALYTAGTLALILAQGPTTLYMGRVLLGIAAGTGTVVVPVLINELAPPTHAGLLCSANQTAIVLGILVSAVAGVWMATEAMWRGLFALNFVPNVLQWLLLPLSVESPPWLAAQGLAQDYKEALARLYNHPVSIEEERGALAQASEAGTSDDDVDDDDGIIDDGAAAARSRQDSSTAPRHLSLKQLFGSPTLRQPLIAALGLHVVQQFSGINAAIFYSTTIFMENNPVETATKLTVLVSVVNLIMTLLSASLIDILGRRTLLLTSEAAMAFCAAAIYVASNVMLAPPAVVGFFLIAFVGSFAIGLGAIPWIILPELLPAPAITVAASLGTALNWGCAFLLALLFPAAISALGYTVFLLFAVFLVASFVATWKFVPETKGGALRL
ncbi:hypothetical protein HDU86_002356 [Geranomyces michiganensis]|nr:hypothetical protein HDU86_002356 [Geranomyces michiganensis]